MAAMLSLGVQSKKPLVQHTQFVLNIAQRSSEAVGVVVQPGTKALDARSGHKKFCRISAANPLVSKLFQKLIVMIESHRETLCKCERVDDLTLEPFVGNESEFWNKRVENWKRVFGQGKYALEGVAKRKFPEGMCDFNCDVSQGSFYLRSNTSQHTGKLGALLGLVALPLQFTLLPRYPHCHKNRGNRAYRLHPRRPLIAVQTVVAANNYGQDGYYGYRCEKPSSFRQLFGNNCHPGMLA